MDGEKDIEEGGGVLHKGADVKYVCNEAPIDAYLIRPMCERVSTSGFYAAWSRAPSARNIEQLQIVTEIRRA